MGASIAALHILVPLARVGEARDAVGRAYAKIGWSAPARGEEADRHALLAAGASTFLSVHDSACTGQDDGTLKALAALLSKSLNTVCIVTLVRDGDDFEFILFHKGIQADSAVGEPDGHGGGLKSVRGRAQALLWHEAFGGAHFRAISEAGGGKFSDRSAVFVALAGAAARNASPLAEDRLGAWCELAGLPRAAAVSGARSAGGKDGAVTHLALASRPVARKAAAEGAGRTLAFFASPEDYPYHGFFPSAWPVANGAVPPLIWPVLCRGGGLQGFRLCLHIDRTGGFVLKRVSVAAYAFHNGQIASQTPLASFGQSLPEDIALTEADLSFDADSFVLRTPPPDSKAAYILLIRVELVAPHAGEAMMTPSFRADGPASAPLMLPTLRVAVTKPRWVPIVADALDTSPGRTEALLRLNAPALHTAVAILPDTGDDVRTAMRALMEQVCSPLATAGLVATVHTHKHMIPGFSVAKSAQTVPLATLMQSALWAKLFETNARYQTVKIGIGVPDAPWPLAGLNMQASLRAGQDDDADAPRFSGPTVSVAVWAMAELGALSMLGLDSHVMLAQFAAWIRQAGVLQGWAADCAWFPQFDYYDDYMMTPYEQVSQVDWFRLGLKGTLTDRAWLRRRLRFVAPLLWLGWELAEQVNVASLAAFADITDTDDCVEIALHDPAALNRLEKALAPILPLNI
jgi:hypothetical protein